MYLGGGKGCRRVVLRFEQIEVPVALDRRVEVQPRFGVRGGVVVCQRVEARYGNHASCRFGPMADGGFKVSLTLPVETRARV